MKRQAAERRGRTAETIAAWWLRLHGWRIVARRAKTHVGEIARRGHVLAFVEVKARGSAAELDFALDRRRLARVARAAELLAPRFARAGDDIRIDALFLAPGRLPRHSPDVWLG